MRPYVVVNVAMSADGKLSTRERRQVRISGGEDFARADQLKAGSDAVMVGIGTVLADDPSLTVKGEENRRLRQEQGIGEHPIRIVVDSAARIPLTASILHRGAGERVIAVSHSADARKVVQLKKLATVIEAGETEVDLPAVFAELGARGIRRLMVEGGGTLIAALLAAGLVDEIYAYVGDIIIGGKNAPTLADGKGFAREQEFVRLTLLDTRRIGSGILLHWKVVNRSDERPENRKVRQ